MVDRYTKIVLTVIALALTALALRPFLLPRVVTAGEGSRAGLDFSSPQTIDVPRSWGGFVAASDNFPFFESPEGTIRKQPVVGGLGPQWARK